MTRRVVITGMGLICPLGNSAEALWSGLVERRSGISPLDAFPHQSLPVKFAGQCRQFNGEISQYGQLDPTLQKAIKKGTRLMCREIAMGVAAAQLALQDAGLNQQGYDSDRSGVVFGSDYIMTAPEEFVDGVRHCTESDRFEFTRWGQRGLNKVTPLWLLKYLPNMPASHIAIYNDLRGPSNSLTYREASSNLSVAEAYCAIQRGAADMMVAGATGSRIHPLRTVHVVLQEELAYGDDGARCCPFDRDRRGAVLGEGAGAVVLEDMERAIGRGATIAAEVIGYGSSIVRDVDGVAYLDRAIAQAASQALHTSRLTGDDIGHVHAHGLATRRSDLLEAQAIAEVFQTRRRPIPVLAAKSYLGNLGAGGGMIELASSILAMGQRQSFPVLGFETLDPQCPIHVVRDPTTDLGKSVLNINVTPQGQASCLVVRMVD